MLQSPIKPVDRKVLDHPIEQRGMVRVPLDYTHPNRNPIEVFYRLIPSYGLKPNDPSKPVLVVINGGPGIPSSFYRAIDFDYQKEVPEKFDRFKYLLREFRILLVDQRGTDGQSVPLDMKSPDIRSHEIAKYFSSDFQARDYAKVIETVIPKNESFYMIAQSYGGMVGMQYLSLNDSRKPKGIIFSCSALPHEDFKDAMLSRRREQLKLNHHLKQVMPDIEQKILAVRKHLEIQKINPNKIHNLFTFLGKNKEGLWEKSLSEHLDKMLTQERDTILKAFHEDLDSSALLNAILSSANFTPGTTDRTLAKLSSELIPFEPWMFDENWMLMQIGMDQEWSKNLLLEMDRAPPPATPFAPVDELRKAIAQNQLLFLSADNDAFVPSDAYDRAIQKFLVPGHTEVIKAPGGHHAVFLEDGFKVVCDWTGKIQ